MRKSPFPQYSALVEWVEGEVQKEPSPTAVESSQQSLVSNE